MTVRCKRFNRQNALKALDLLIDFEFTVWIADLENCLILSLNHNLAVYDTAYIDIAINKQTALWTMDKSLKRAAESLGLTVLP